MANTTQKAFDMARFTQDDLVKRLGKLGVTVDGVSFDTDGNPLVKCGTGVVGAAGGLLKWKPIDTPLSLNAVKLPAEVFTPHIVQLVTEANPTAGAGADINSAAILAELVAACVEQGCEWQWYVAPNGTAPDASQIITANLKATRQASLYFPAQAAQ